MYNVVCICNIVVWISSYECNISAVWSKRSRPGCEILNYFSGWRPTDQCWYVPKQLRLMLSIVSITDQSGKISKKGEPKLIHYILKDVKTVTSVSLCSVVLVQLLLFYITLCCLNSYSCPVAAVCALCLTTALHLLWTWANSKLCWKRQSWSSNNNWEASREWIYTNHSQFSTNRHSLSTG